VSRGILVAMSELHVWTVDNEEWVVAESAVDACAVYCAHSGDEPLAEDSDGEDFDGTHPNHWTEVPDDHVIKWGEECDETHKEGVPCPRGCDDAFLIHRTPTCAEMVAESGRGYLGSAG
jgi:hypothetical protein